jgi:hypothetical protein
MVFLGQGDTGKSHTIYSVFSAIKGKGEKLSGTATAGKVATVIGGSTIHSKTDGLGIPTEVASYRQRMCRFRNFKIVSLD